MEQLQAGRWQLIVAATLLGIWLLFLIAMAAYG